ncbi:Internalin H [Methanosarcinaceae archaeon Ag5]|uniref:Internalin H n=1 Tax=Methanolapillus africanus TaxID=3028297 RepID=A0AAE4MHK0_9EURY|nr:Internalin H [Methanosarcinaceae archaeon Ag5]
MLTNTFRKLSVFLLISLILLALTPSALADDTLVNVPDANLKKAINTQLNLDANHSLTVSDMANLTSLVAQSAEISNLTGLEYAVNLQSLYLNKNEISDISALANLTNLSVLDLGGNNISNISAVSGLTKLEYLYVNDNKISNVSPAENLLNLKELYINNNSVSNISVLYNLTNMEALSIAKNPIFDVSVLKNMGGMTTLDISDTVVQDARPIYDLNLKILSISFDQKPVVNMSEIETLDLLFISDDPVYYIDLEDDVITFTKTIPAGSVLSVDNPAFYPDGHPIPPKNGSISNGGTYNAATNTITWESLDSVSSVKFSFDNEYEPGFSGSVVYELSFSSAESSGLSTTTWVLVIVAIVLIILIAGGVYLYSSKKKNQ